VEGGELASAAPFSCEEERVPDDELVRAKKFVVDGILPCGLVHIVAAPVGTGKTTIFMQQIHAMQNGLEWLTKKAYPHRVVYITADRGKAETDATIARLGLTGIEFKLVSLKDQTSPAVSPLELILHNNCQEGDLAIVEPLNFFLKDGAKSGNINDFGHVSRFLLSIGRKAEEMQITIEGSLHSSKAKQGQQYMVAREKVIGSVAWTAFTATTIILEPNDPATCDDPGRTIHVLPRDMRPFTLGYVVEPEHGLLVPTAKTLICKSALDRALDVWPQDTWTRSDTNDWAAAAELSDTTAKRWLQQLEADGRIIRVERGVYKRVDPS
jgi:AAA domain